ncbi:MAG: sulfite exporter TauE/SafE family protein [Anaerolineae bacterium]|nr:sulfite exporter TauE/SafE family protein [Anaerolineae bacterium]
MDFHIVVALACLFIGLSKGGLGGPIPVAMLTPLLSLIMPASQAVGLILIPLMVGDVITVMLYWRKWDLSRVKLLLPMAVVGIFVGEFVLLTLANSGQNIIIKRLIGAFTLIVVIYKVSDSLISRMHYEHRQWHGYLAGWLTGFGSALANVGAPPYTAYMLLQKIDDPVAFLGTTAIFFAILNAIKLPFVLSNSKVLDLHLLASILWALPLIPVGAWLGRKSVGYVNAKLFERVMLVLLFLLSVFTLVA